MLDCPYGSSYEPLTNPLAASTSGPIPVTPFEDQRDRSARAKLTAGAFAGCGTSVGVGAGVLVVTTALGCGVFVPSIGGVVVPTHVAASSVAATAIADPRAPCPLLTRRASRLARMESPSSAHCHAPSASGRPSP